MLLRVLVGAGGVVVVLVTLLSAVRTVVVPRGEQVLVTRVAFAVTRVVVDVLVRLRPGFAWTDRVMSLYAPVSLLLLPLLWLSLIFVGFTALFWAVGEGDVPHALDVAGSSLLTIGFTKPDTPAGVALAFVGGALAIAIVVLLLVTYLPTMYAAFGAREQLVTLLETRAGAPPSAVQFIERLARIRGLGDLDGIWEDWEEWFARVQESHTSQPALVHFRSQRSDESWITAAGALLDAAALYVSCVDHDVLSLGEHVVHVVPGRRGGPDEHVRRPQAEICMRAGYLCLRDLASFFRLPYDPDPSPTDQVSVTRGEFDEAWRRMDRVGVPLVADPDEAWRAFAGWRVNYDEPLVRIAAMVVAPETPWIADARRREWLDRRDDRRRGRG